MSKSVTVITGCSSGIGLSIAARLARDPAKNYLVYATMRNLKKRKEMEKAAGEHLNKTLLIKELDVDKTDSVKSAVRQIIDQHGRIDALVNNAGIAGFNALEYMSYDDIHDIMNTNFMGTVRMMKEIVPHMKDQRFGRIVNVSSLTGVLGYPFYEIYCASKSATEGLTDALACRLHEFNIKLSSVNPGAVNTHINENIVEHGRLPTGHPVDDLTRRQLKLYSRYQKYHFDEKNMQDPEELAFLVQKILEEENPLLRHATSKYGRESMSYRYSDLGGSDWTRHKRRLVEEPGVDIEQLERKQWFGSPSKSKSVA